MHSTTDLTYVSLVTISTFSASRYTLLSSPLALSALFALILLTCLQLRQKLHLTDVFTGKYPGILSLTIIGFNI